MIRIILAGTSGERSLRKHRSLSVSMRILIVFAYIPEGADGNNYPVVVGGGYRMDGATVMILQKKGKEMTLRVLNAKGETLKELNL